MSGRLDGRTRDFGSRNAGSRPAPTTKQEYGPAVQRSGRRPVTAEIAGSNPVRTAKSSCLAAKNSLREREKHSQKLGVDQLVDRVVWDHQAAGSSPAA